ncbi:unnamed protein product [Microthlaspi erraticum]|uniref:Reverse transcriptase n=1 Tax=Microthlaspi erraticum TaxID=1685480 RepID=A0A6D2I0Q3_9BRAS|nr:unnamed protein product [Microthlaspi erraticum]
MSDAQTRSQTALKESILGEIESALGPRLEEMYNRHNDLEEKMDKQLHKIDKDLAGMFDAIRSLSDNVASSSPNPSPDNNSPSFSPPGPTTTHDSHRPRPTPSTPYSGMTRLAKIEFPRFSGDRFQEWLFQAEQFFSIDNTPEDLKVNIASVHFDGLAANWHQSIVQSELGQSVLSSWPAYKLRLHERFEDILDDPILELKRLQETNGIVEYHGRFELLRTRVNFSEDYLVRHYLAGLQTETQMHVRMFQPTSVRQCLLLGRLYEQAHPKKPQFFRRKDSEMRPTQVEKTPEKEYAPQKFLTNAEMVQRRKDGLCYYCPEKYTPGHFLKHKKTQLFMIETGEEDDLEAAPEIQNEEEEAIDIATISVNVVSGISDYNTLRVKGECGKRSIFVLIDSGSTHNFVDTRTAEKLGCTVRTSTRSRVTVADGRRIAIQGHIDNFRWTFHGTTFESDVMVIPLGGCDMVLGVQWLHTLGPITFDFKKLEMSFKWEARKILLHGIKQDSVRHVKAAKLNKLQDEDVQLAMLYVQSGVEEEPIQFYSLDATTTSTTVCPAIDGLLTEFFDIFEEPTTLPPFREHHNHRIPLLEGSNPVNQRPYRYAIHQKNEIDTMVQELLTAGTIQPSSSSFASPVVLVKKKDGNWRLCVDYRGLNGLTVKDRFPIPLIEDLMDELGGSKVYSKIDLRAGYHQVRMDPLDVHKTAFKTHGGHFEYLVMPFGLTNAPATFQSLMNSIFKEFLRKFVLIFFDDILIYSSSMELHITHLRCVFELMRQNSLFAKQSKCSFATDRVEYLGHFIEEKGISTDPSKVKAVADWPIPVNLKQLRGFLGLAGYYRRFVKNFGTIARPLTALTKKDSFEWSEEALHSFKDLKRALCEAPVLALPLFDTPFVVETDACSQGIGAVLMQNGHPLAYISRHLKGKQLHLSIYEKELLAVVFAVTKWRHYLLNGHFVIKTDQRSLKYLLEQRLNTPIQQQWLPKLLEFDYEIQYKQGKENLVADALSRVEGAEVLHMAMSVLQCDLLQQIQAGYDTDPTVRDLIAELQQKPLAKKHFSWTQGILRRKSKIVVPDNVLLRNKVLEWLHCSGSGGHSGRDATHQRVKGLFYWKGMSKDIQSYIRGCNVCQQCKYDPAASPGLIQPLPIPETIWTDISMDFIDGLPSSYGKTVIFVVVDRLSKAAHFMALSHPYTASSIAQVFLDNVFKLHGFPQSIVSDRDAIFLSDFWRELFSLQGVALNLSSAFKELPLISA